MRSAIFSSICLLSSTTYVVAGCTPDAGMTYCNQVEAITYTNFGQPGTYNEITSMANGKCTSSPKTYSGGMGPLSDEVSWHFRGPLRLKQFAFYSPSTPVKRDNTFIHRGRARLQPHGHDQESKYDLQELDQHELDKDLELKYRDTTNMVTATINGQIVSWPLNSPPLAPTATPTKSSSTPATTSTTPNPNTDTTKWVRQGYYNAAQKSASGLVFLNNKGGLGSGVWDATFGNSLSYASSDASTGSPTSQILADTLINDNDELILFTSTACTSNDCGYVRPGGINHHGFSGASKLFLLEFSMPNTGKRGFNMDMPAAWILNAQIPRTMQYADPPACSCWSSGCGEWDVFEVLSSGNQKCVSSFHARNAGGDPDWFARPVARPVKVAVWFDGVGKRGVISLLPDDAVFDASLDHDVLMKWLGSVDGAKRSTFALPN